ERIQTAKDLGFDEVLNASDLSLKEKVLSMTDRRGVDLVVLTAGNTQVYANVIQFVRDGGSINIFAGLPPGSQLTYDVNEIYSREITVYSSYSPSPDELTEALEMLKNKIVRVDIL